MESDERIVQVGDVDLCTQAFGEAGDPPILLIAGNEASMDWWEDEFCRLLASASRYVIRYDSRDTGRSTRFPSGAPGYSGEAMIDDAIGVLDAYRLGMAHIVGISSGGGIAQYLGVWHPERIASLTLLSTTPMSPAERHPDLPPVTDAVARFFADPPPPPNWQRRESVIDSFITNERVFAGGAPVDQDRIRRIVTRAMDRGGDLASSANHWLVEGSPLGDRLGEITAPTLVLHGTEDPLFPYGHGEALAAEVPSARLQPMAGVGHQHPPPERWDEVIAAIVDHTARPAPR